MTQEITRVQQSPNGWYSTQLNPRSVSTSSAASSSDTLLAVIGHISDTHICDSQSPARLPFTNRYGDPDHPFSEKIGGPVGNYRPQEMLTTQVLASMVKTINRSRGPISGERVSVTVVTGDLTDNSQSNELKWVKALLTGGQLRPNSGSETGFEGPGDGSDPHYWNPESAGEDRAQRLFGFPHLPGLLEVATESLRSEGLDSPLIAVHGNHDALLQGTVPINQALRDLAVSHNRPTELVDPGHLFELASNFSPIGPARFPGLEHTVLSRTVPDAGRDFLQLGDFEATLRASKYGFVEFGKLLLVSLDTVNEHGGWNGSLSREQFYWLENTLREHAHRPVILLSHHPLETLDNGYSPNGPSDRVLASELVALINRNQNVILWLAGHEHRNRVHRISQESSAYLIETCSLIDWPQEGRLLEIFENDDEYVIHSSMIAHDSPIGLFAIDQPAPDLSLASSELLAGISRELSANDWQRQQGQASVDSMFGQSHDRNVVLRVPKIF